MEQIRDFETFEPSQIITPDDYPLPKEGHIGYVKFENPNDYVGETEPRWFDDELMPTVGVYCTMACADYEPPRLLSASESEEILSKTKLVYADCN